MSLWEMLSELKDQVDDCELENDDCANDHATPSDTSETCRVCFILNLWEHCSEDGMDEELSQKQKDYIVFLWEKHCDQSDPEWSGE